jgi:uncharacterized protein (TIGR02217 family)
MAFIETPRFPDSIAFGAVSGPEFSTDIVITVGGQESRNANWAATRGRYEVGLVNKDKTTTDALIAFFRAVAYGRANAFRFKDHNDFEAYDQPIGTGDGADTTFQLVKVYTSGAQTYTRTITKPVTGTVTAKLAGTPTTAFTTDTTTGIITFSVAPGLGVAITASCEFDTPVRFDSDWLSLQRVDIDIYSWQSIVLLEVRDIA